MLFDERTCVSECPIEYVHYIEEGLCGPICESNQLPRWNDKYCQSCDGLISGASRCSYSVKKEVLVDDCEVGFVSKDKRSCQECDYDEFINGIFGCAKCSDHYGAFCTECDSEECTQCQGTISLNEGECACLKQEFIDVETLSCKSCHLSSILSNCLECSDEETECHLCESGTYLNQNSRCVTDPCRDYDESGKCVSCNEDPDGDLIP